MANQFRTISSISKGLYKEKGSKFISLAYPVTNENEIKNILEELRKKYFDARHHCYAWCLGDDRERQRANDDGEPSSSAGKPILGQINANDLTNILIVVIRYFGGTLLGVGGLINAYREASSDAIQNNKIIEKKVFEVYKVSFEYQQMNNIMTIIKGHRLDQFDQDFALSCSVKIRIWKKDSERIVSEFKSLEGVSIDIENI